MGPAVADDRIGILSHASNIPPQRIRRRRWNIVMCLSQMYNKHIFCMKHKDANRCDRARRARGEIHKKVG